MMSSASRPLRRLVIAEDYALFCELLQKYCTRDLGYEVVCATDNVITATEMILAEKPDAVLLDLQLRDGDGFAVMEQSQRVDHRVGFVVVSAHCNAYNVYRAERAGVVGWIDKDTQMLTDLKKALKAVFSGKSYFSPTYLGMQRTLQRDSHSFTKILTEWEWKILALIGEALTDEEIAARSGITPSTAKTHRGVIMRKLGIPSTPKLIRYALTMGLAHLASQAPFIPGSDI